MTLRCRRALARWLVALLLLPVLLGAIPASQLSAEQALARDLALSICTPNSAQDQGRVPGSHDGQCVLCTLGCATCTPMVPVSAAAALLPAQRSGPYIVTPIAATEPNRLHWRDGSPPRGPPLSLIV